MGLVWSLVGAESRVPVDPEQRSRGIQVVLRSKALEVWPERRNQRLHRQFDKLLIPCFVFFKPQPVVVPLKASKKSDPFLRETIKGGKFLDAVEWGPHRSTLFRRSCTTFPR